jgi:D-lactate dehydrogenase
LAKKLDFAYVPLNTLLAKSDIISLHTPLLPSTYHIINKKNIRKIKKGAYIINTARGALIEPEALVWGLESGHIAGAGLDVLETEEFLQHPATFFFSERKERHTGATRALNAKMTKVSLMNELIIDHPRTIVTPHNAFNSTEALERIFDTTVENVLAFAKGKTQNDVTQTKKK